MVQVELLGKDEDDASRGLFGCSCGHRTHSWQVGFGWGFLRRLQRSQSWTSSGGCWKALSARGIAVSLKLLDAKDDNLS